jgi:hypothetical protein
VVTPGGEFKIVGSMDERWIKYDGTMMATNVACGE